VNILPVSIRNSPALVRAAPFVIFVLLTAAQPYAGETGQYWVYLLKTVVGAAMILAMRPLVSEMRWKFSWAALLAGVTVFFLWIKIGDLMRLIGLSSLAHWPTSGKLWNPRADYGGSSALAIFFLVVRVVGSTLVVPPFEEVFFRSFVYRFIAKPDFQSVPIGQFLWTPFMATSVLFGLEHGYWWLAGILCGFVYQGLVCWKKRLGDAIAAHAITNFLLGCWIVIEQQWQFW
jgi:CAAX prenyl protease-like protein